MSAKGTKQSKEKHQIILNDLLREDPNRYCADCRAKGPRWASWNLGVFLCIRCAGIHRNLGVHISRVKSVNLDSWTPEQIESIEKWGNGRAAEYYECYLPEDFIRPHGDSAMETLIRNKYERKLYMKKDGKPPLKKETSATVKPPADERKERPKEIKQKPAQTKRVETKAERKVVAPAQTAIERPVAAAPKPQAAPVIDLLGMDNPTPAPSQPFQQPAPVQNGNDDFDLFMQSPPAASAPQGQAGPVSQSQLNAFPGSVPANRSSESLLLEDKTPAPANTKASIMSLYQSGNQQQKPIFGVPGGLYVTQQQGMNSQMMGGFSQKQPSMQMGQHSMQMAQPSMQMAQPSMQMGHSSMQMGHSSMQMGQPQMMMNRQNVNLNMGATQPNMGTQKPNMGMQQPNMGMQQPNMGMQQPNMGMSQNQNMMSNMMMMQNQMQNLNMGPRGQMAGMTAPRNQFMPGNFQASLGQSIMANSYGSSRSMMPAQQPILVNGPAAGLASGNMNTSPAMGHTLSNQLWK